MKKYISLTLGLCLAAATVVNAQDAKENEGYKFTDLTRLPATSVKSQDRTGTCWAWSALSMLESEMMRMGKDSVSLSPMYVVWNTFHEKGDKYIRMNGRANFSQGGAAADVLWAIRNYGIVPHEVYAGHEYDEVGHFHGELNSVLKFYVDGVRQTPNFRISNVWQKGFDGVLNAYLGEKPEKFAWKGKEYTPQAFAKDFCGLNPDDYVTLTSFTHHPFYTSFILEVEDNWLCESAYNIPMEELMEILDKAIDKGYTFVWASDISESGFDRNKGIAVTPDENVIHDMSDSEKARFLKMPEATRCAELMKNPCKEKKITQELRQAGFNDKTTSDDHGMHIIGKAVDQAGSKYFIVKNSWGTERGEYGGYNYASYPFVAFKTTSAMIHKDALPKELKKKLGIR